MIAFIRVEDEPRIFLATSSGSRFNVSGDTSANTWSRVLIQDAVRSRTESHRGRDGFISRAQARGTGSSMQRSSPRTEAYGVTCSYPVRELFFKFFNFRPGRQPIRFQDAYDGFNIRIVQALAPIRQHRLRERACPRG